MMPWLTLTIFFPLFGGLVLYMIPARRAWPWIAAVTTGTTLALSLLLCARFEWGASGLQLEDRIAWIPALGASYHMGLDGVSLPLVLLTTVLMFLSVVYAWKTRHGAREYFALYLVLETGLLGLFSTLDLLLFYLFWEVAMVPMYFIIGIWGLEARRKAALKFFLYTRVSALALLVCILALYLGTDPRSFNLLDVLRDAPYAGRSLGASLILLGFLIAFGIKLPVVPLHNWLADAHTQAPTDGSVILAGLLLKLGGYGFIRLALPLVPGAFDQWAPWIALVGALSALYGVSVAMAQQDLKRLIALSSVNHMGYVLVGVAAAAALGASYADRVAAASGAVYQLVAHGIVTGALFFLAGILSERTGTREIDRLSGIWKALPWYGSVLAFAMFASFGLPGLAHFAAEVQILLGTLGIYAWAAGVVLFAILITTAMFLWTLQRVLMGKLPEPWQALRRLDPREGAVLLTLVLLTVFLGILPGPWIRILQVALTSGPLAAVVGG